MKKYMLLALCALLAGCAPTIDRQKVSSYKNIGAYVMYGDNFEHTHLGSTIFTNEQTSRNVQDWGMRQYATQTLIEEASKVGVKLSPVRLPPRAPSEDGYDYHVKVKAAALQQGFDALMYVSGEVDDTRHSTMTPFPKLLPGYGLYDYNSLLNRRSMVYAGTELKLIDLKKNESVAENYGIIAIHQLSKNSPEKLGITMKNKASDYSASEMQAFEKAIKNIYRESIKTALADIK